jgi:hypothetical protein
MNQNAASGPATDGHAPPPGASEPTPAQPKTPSPPEPVPSDSNPPGAEQDLPETQYGKADPLEKPDH